MCKKSKFPLVFNIFLAFFITLVVTLFVQAGQGTLSVPTIVVGMIQGISRHLPQETIIELPPHGNTVVNAAGIKNPGGAAAYFVRTLAIVFVIVILMSFILMFCEAGFALGGAFFGFWTTKVPAIFVVAYVTALIAIAPSMKASMAICSREG